MKSPIILRLFKNNQLIEVKQFDRDQIIFGQDADVQVDLKGDQVSSIHCLIELRDSGYYLCDLGSQSGTFKNGKQILDEAISSGDKIGIGSYEIHFFVGVPKGKDDDGKPKVTAIPSQVREVAKPTINVKPVNPPAPKIPETHRVEKRSLGSDQKQKKRRGNTFAPASEISDLKSYLKAQKGSRIEVIVAWKERVLATYHFASGEVASIGPSQKANIKIPSGFLRQDHEFLNLKTGYNILIPIEAKADVLVGSQAKAASAGSYKLGQGEILCLSFDGGTVQIFVRFAPETPRPLGLPFLDLSAGELSGLIVTFVMVSLTAIWMSVYTPDEVQKEEEDQVRLAQFIYNKPKETPTPTPEPKMPPQGEATAKPTPTPERVKLADKPKEQVTKGNKESIAATTERPEAKAAEVRPKPSKVNRPKIFTSTQQGGAVKVGPKEGSTAQAAKDVSKTGLLAAFGGGGTRSKLDQAYSGSGDLIGMANQATGAAGQNENRDGSDLGSKFKDTGAGGKGTATQGIAGVGTKGRGSGQADYGGVGFGGKGNVRIDAGGAEEAFEGMVDKEAVRRVIRNGLPSIRSCYERALATNRELEGKIVVQFLVGEQGRVKTSTVKSSTMNNSSVESCVAARVRSFNFPEPPLGKEYEVIYPFVFSRTQ